MACPSKQFVEGMAPLSLSQVQFICSECNFTGTDREIYEDWVKKFNWLPPPPETFEGGIYAWIAANFTPS